MILTGLCAFPITPAGSDGHVDRTAWRRLLARLVEGKVDSIGLLGSTGTYAYLSETERCRALDRALEEVNGRVPVVVGIGALRTDAAVRLARHARDAGAAAGLLAPVSYTPLLDDEVFEHFATVARDGGLPLCIYDNPATTHFTFGPALLGRLCGLPGVVALKTPAAPRDIVAKHLADLRCAATERFSLGFSGDWHATEALIAGGDAWYSVAAGLFPATCAAIVAATRAGDAFEARRLDTRLRPLWELFQRYSSLRVAYAAADLLDLCRAEPPRPILPLPDAARQEISAALEVMDLL